MKKLLLLTVLALSGTMLFGQGGIAGGPAQVTVANAPAFLLYGESFNFDLALSLAGVTGNEAVGLGGFVVPVGFDLTKFQFHDAANLGLPGDPNANPPTLTFVSTDPTIANAQAFFAVVGATSVSSVGPAYTVANVTGRSMLFGSLTLDLTTPTTPAQVALSLSSKWTASNGGPETITAAGADYSLNTTGILVGDYGDYDGDGKTDALAFLPSTGSFYLLKSTDGSYVVTNWGDSTCTPVPGDYDGDNLADVGVYQESTGMWAIMNSSGGTTVVGWGVPDSAAAPADYDGDGKTDVCIYQKSTGMWIAQYSSTGAGVAVNWGGSGYIPIPGYYDNDALADFGVYQPSTGTFAIILSTTGGYKVATWGDATCIPITGDFDGDGLDDIAVYQPVNGMWAFVRSSDGTTGSQSWGNADMMPVPGDYDGDGKTDAAIYHQPSGMWAWYNISTGAYGAYNWGGSSYIAIGR